MQKQYNFYEDPGHGWLEVPFADFKAVGIKTSDISHFSYRSRENLYLEEDCDAAVFMSAYKAKFGKDASLVFNEHGDFVRKLPGIHSISVSLS